MLTFLTKLKVYKIIQKGWYLNEEAFRINFCAVSSDNLRYLKMLLFVIITLSAQITVIFFHKFFYK